MAKKYLFREDCTGHRLVLSDGDVPPYLRPTLYHFGDDKVMKIQGGLFKFGKLLTKIDFLNLRNMLPKRLYIYLYQRLLKLAKLGLFKRDTSLAGSIILRQVVNRSKEIESSWII